MFGVIISALANNEFFIEFITFLETRISPEVETITGSITSFLFTNVFWIYSITSILFIIPILTTSISRSEITESIWDEITFFGRSKISWTPSVFCEVIDVMMLEA